MSTLKLDALTTEERTAMAEGLLIVLNARQDAKTLPYALRWELSAHRDMAWLARRTGLNRTALFRTLALGGNPTLASLSAILHACGLRLSVLPLRD